MFAFEIGDKVSIGFNAVSDEERQRLENAMSVGKLSGKITKSRVVQANHQTVNETGTVLEQSNRAPQERSDGSVTSGVQYLVLVDATNSAGRKRMIPEEKLSTL